MEKWLGLLTPAGLLFGFLLTAITAGLIRAKVEQISRTELARLAAEWRSTAEDRDKLLVALRDEQKTLQQQVDSQLIRLRELDGECMQLTRESWARERYIRELVATLKEHQVPVPLRER